VPKLRAGASLLTAVTGAAAALVAVSAAAAPDIPVDLSGLLARVGERVEAYYARAQSIMCIETVRVQRMTHDLVPEPHVRVLVYELRVSREGATDADPMPEVNVVRQLKTVNGRVPKPKEDPDCLDPNPVTLDPLSFLLPTQQADYRFSYKGSSRLDGRSVATIGYTSAGARPVEATWRDGCVSVDAPGRTTGRVWIDSDSGDVVRIDEQMRGPIELPIPSPQRREGGPAWLTFERADESIRYKAVAFADPGEIVLLPESIVTMSVASGGFASIRMTHTFTGYQRFVTGARVVP
jgi:hypothetical protein